MKYYYVFNTKEEASEFIAEFTACVAEKCASMTFGTATGSTFTDVYAKMVNKIKRLSSIKYIRQMDNYYQGPAHATSGMSGYEKEIWNAIAKYLPGVDFDIPKEFAWDKYAESLRFEASRRIASTYSALWLQYVGIGSDGHIAFNEPGDDMYASVHPVDLADQTLSDNARFFGNKEADVPKTAITSGMANILGESDIIVFAAFGDKKAEIVEKALLDPIDSDNPATLLRLFAGNLVYVLDTDAASTLCYCDEETCTLSPEQLAVEILA